MQSPVMAAGENKTVLHQIDTSLSRVLAPRTPPNLTRGRVCEYTETQSIEPEPGCASATDNETKTESSEIESKRKSESNAGFQTHELTGNEI
jgi:hypothetical protein